MVRIQRDIQNTWESRDVKLILSITGIDVFSAMLITVEIVDAVLRSAYEAEINSLRHHKYSTRNAIIITMPFLIIYLVVRLFLDSDPASKNSKTHDPYMPVIISFAEIFWLVNDIIDVLQDLESDYLNSVIYEIKKKIGPVESSHLSHKILIELLNGVPKLIMSHLTRSSTLTLPPEV